MKILAMALTIGILSGLFATCVHAEEQLETSSTTNTVITEILQKITGPTRQPFHPMNADPTLIRKSMQARSEYDKLTRQSVARKKKLYEENPTIKKLQANMRKLQKNIDDILETDEELTQLKAKLENISPQTPTIQKKQRPASSGSQPKKK